MDTDQGTWQVVSNDNEHHSHGVCHPLKSLQGHHIDALVCLGIGAEALGGLKEAGISVYRSDGATVGELVERFKDGKLEKIDLEAARRCHGYHRRT